MPRYSLDDTVPEAEKYTVYGAEKWTGKTGWAWVYGNLHYHDLMKNSERDTALNNANYCYPCVWAGGAWSTADNKNFCTFTNRVLSYLWTANPHKHGPRGTRVPLLVD
jgi:hypothetical protein